MPEKIEPWINLITWEFLTLIGGLAVLPALYIVVLRIKKGRFAGVELDLSAREVSFIAEAAEEVAE